MLDLLFLKNLENVFKYLNICFSKETLKLKTLLLVIPETIFLYMMVRGQMHVILGVVDMEICEKNGS